MESRVGTAWPGTRWLTWWVLGQRCSDKPPGLWDVLQAPTLCRVPGDLWWNTSPCWRERASETLFSSGGWGGPGHESGAFHGYQLEGADWSRGATDASPSRGGSHGVPQAGQHCRGPHWSMGRSTPAQPTVVGCSALWDAWWIMPLSRSVPGGPGDHLVLENVSQATWVQALLKSEREASALRWWDPLGRAVRDRKHIMGFPWLPGDMKARVRRANHMVLVPAHCGQQLLL